MAQYEICANELDNNDDNVFNSRKHFKNYNIVATMWKQYGQHTALPFSGSTDNLTFSITTLV